ncbi:Sodium/potassium/calcium exchanger 2 [Nibea albiflora]|uniref:Sodium/potassium/calcium exchanger 2 n=1 Tax=Nibea albiflora TaxID=240163 RepID=A0ACB7FEU9_NIBAL|nr:Sodium/potassium/calcium exchanger 2 [Nibea albiflora]
MHCTRRKRLQLSRVLFLLSGVFLCTLYQLTISARLYDPLPMPQIGEDFGEGSTEVVEEPTVEPQGLEEPLTATQELEHTDQTTPEMHVVSHQVTTSDPLTSASTTAESPPSTTTNRTIVHCIYVVPEPPQETPTPAPAPTPPVTTTTIITTTPSSPGEAPHIKGEYPEDIFSIEDRRQGWVILHIIGMMYMFISLAIVCDEFFVPALGVITDKLAISDDVAGATFMAAGGSAPELFTSLIGVFIAHSNVGIGTIVGSAVFNILFVIGMCALFSREVLHLTWWPLFRDVSFYILDLILLILFFLDNVIMWWESLMLVTSYTVYVIFMKFNVQIERAFKSQLHKHKNIVKAIAVEESETLKPSLQRGGSSASLHNSTMRSTIFQLMIHTLDPLREDGGGKSEQTKEPEPAPAPAPAPAPQAEKKEQPEDKKVLSNHVLVVFKKPRSESLIPVYKSRKFFVVTFLGSIVWIAVFSYLMVWWAHQVGETIGISEEIMGLTILAAGTSIPDLITSVIVARKGMGDMAVSSSVGSNIFDITMGLPIPWLLYSSINSLAPVTVSSNGLFCAIVLLFIMLLFVIASIATCKWKMNKALGFTMFLLYFIFLVLSVMLEDRIIICPVSI